MSIASVNLEGSMAAPMALRAAFTQCRSPIAFIGLFSALINLLALSSSIYMLQVYDRVLPSHSVPTLVVLSILMLLLFAGYGVLDVVRSRMMVGLGLRIDRVLRERVFAAALRPSVRTPTSSDGQLPLRDLDQIRTFLSGAGPIALIDMPWMPFYLGLVFLLHPWFGWLTTLGAIALTGLTLLTELRSRGPTRRASDSATARTALSDAAHRNVEVVCALGMSNPLAARWHGLSETHNAHTRAATDIGIIYGTMSKVLRLVLQSAILGLGAYLVIQGQATGGVMIAASILASRALAPIEIAIANWRGFIAARQSAQRLSVLLASSENRKPTMELPPPENTLSVEGLWVCAPGRQTMIVRDVAFNLHAGEGLGIIGPSASGKSTLARALCGVWSPQRGTIRLDGAELEHWPGETRARHIGYLPQEKELFDDTVACNIARMSASAQSSQVIAAARAAGAHEMILGLSEGYETRIGVSGTALSAGQRQRIALARALFGDPFLVILDEPNSNLDSEGDHALTSAIASVRGRGGIIIVIAHRPSALAGLNKVLVMGAGQAQAFGPKDEVLKSIIRMPSRSRQNMERANDGARQ